jgi:hypothetical protein
VRIESLYRAVQAAKGFQKQAVQGEMLGAIAARRQKLQARLRVIAGGKADQLSPKELMDQYNELLRACTDFKHIEDDCFAQIDALSKQTHEAAKIMALTVQIKNLHATWIPKYDDMADLAQTHGFGKDIYWRYKPDQARLAEAVRTGGAAKASEAKPETAEKRRSVQKAQAESEDEARQKRKAHDDNMLAEMKRIEAQLPGTYRQAMALGTQLSALLDKQEKPAALKLYNQADALFHKADLLRKKVRPNYAEDITTTGKQALDGFVAALALLQKGVAMYPKAK